MLLSQAALGGLERVLNKALEYDPASRYRLSELAGQVLAINMSTPELTFYLMPETDGIALMSDWDGEVDARLSGSFSALARLPLSDVTNLRDTGVSFVGKTNLVAGLTQIAKNLDIDWEEILSQWIGDVAGHQAAQLIRAQMNWLGARAKSAQRLTGEFLTHELHALPSRSELQAYYQGVDDIRFGLDRVDAKLRQLLVNNKSIL